jgi:hypothetical protein
LRKQLILSDTDERDSFKPLGVRASNELRVSLGDRCVHAKETKNALVVCLRTRYVTEAEKKVKHAEGIELCFGDGVCQTGGGRGTALNRGSRILPV